MKTHFEFENPPAKPFNQVKAMPGMTLIDFISNVVGFVHTTARWLLRPLRGLPWRAGKIDFAPVPALVLVLPVAPLSRRGLSHLHQRLL
jgi:hypothetical protein